MSTLSEARPEERSGRGTFWALVPVVLLVASTAGVGTLASIAARDPGFALERDYYQRAVHWDGQEREWAKNSELGYHVAVELSETSDGPLLVARVTDRAGVALRAASVRMEAFANARAAARREVSLAEQPDGTYTASLAKARPGLWEFRFTVTAGGERFTAIERADVPSGSRL